MNGLKFNGSRSATLGVILIGLYKISSQHFLVL